MARPMGWKTKGIIEGLRQGLRNQELAAQYEVSTARVSQLKNIYVPEYVKPRHTTFVDMTGKKVGMLTYLELVEVTPKPNRRPIWKVQCECGVVKNKFRDLSVKSCGCFKGIQPKSHKCPTRKNLPGQDATTGGNFPILL